eukprot:TRINITY_DN537_c0_g1_i2.p1 TRINITY_DN537_c0_g1~~TRINITY_DN537_c0_g1_i2.p1  ORF type:complete len:191 (-),score=89.60 TRINITY_DN537_c0_g1_i2:64-603(-)
MSNPDVKVDELVAKDHGTKIKTFEEVANERDAQKLEEEKARAIEEDKRRVAAIKNTKAAKDAEFQAMKEQKKREEEERKQKEIAAIKEAQERAKLRAMGINVPTDNLSPEERQRLVEKSQSQDSKYLEERRKEEEKKNAMKNRAAFFSQKEEENSQDKAGGKTPEISGSVASKKAAFQN